MLDGNVVSEPDGLVLVVNASNGDTWRAKAIKDEALEQAVPELAEELAFRMLVAEQNLQGYGLTYDGQPSSCSKRSGTGPDMRTNRISLLWQKRSDYFRK